MRNVREPAFWELREALDKALPDWPSVVLRAWIRESDLHNHSRPFHGKPTVQVSEDAFRLLATAKEPTRILVLNRLLDRIQIALSHGVTADQVVCALGSLEDPTREDGGRNLVVRISLGDLLRL